MHSTVAVHSRCSPWNDILVLPWTYSNDFNLVSTNCRVFKEIFVLINKTGDDETSNSCVIHVLTLCISVKTYKLKVYTGMDKDADTDAEVYVNLFGANGDTGKRQLLDSTNDLKFQVGQVCVSNFNLQPDQKLRGETLIKFW